VGAATGTRHTLSPGAGSAAPKSDVRLGSADPTEIAMEQFITGAIAMGSCIAALFFLRFWRETGDRLFALFSLAFLLMGIARYGLATSYIEAVVGAQLEGQTHWYWVRLAAFVIILVAIIDKNRR
jgi:alpha-D-ribose 1-methylphosphonate 5-triphosphate synthase subunit PhnI